MENKRQIERFYIEKFGEKHIFLDDVLKKIKVELSYQEVIDLFKLTNSIILRKYKGEPTLIFGCGNNYHCYNDVEPDYFRKHQHQNCYTVDLEICANPSVIVNLNNGDLSHIPDKSFHLIMSEGGGPILTRNILTKLLRILSDTNGALIWDVKLPDVRHDYEQQLIATSYNGIYTVKTSTGKRMACVVFRNNIIFVKSGYLIDFDVHNLDHHLPVSDEDYHKYFGYMYL